MSRLASGLSIVVDEAEDIARFLTSSSHYSRTTVKPNAFLPSPKDRETSVFRHGPLPYEGLWICAEKASGGRSLHGAAFIKARDVLLAGLSVHPDEPPDRHAVIRGWYWNESNELEQKAQQKLTALLLSSAAGVPEFC